MNLVLVAPQSCRPILVTRLARQLAPPMGLLYLASAVRDECNVSIIDVQAHRLNASEVASAVLARFPDAVGITITFSTMMPGAIELARCLRERAKDLVLVAGGASATFDYARLLANDAFDVVVLHEGEETLVDLIRHLRCGDQIYGLPGTAWRENGTYKVRPIEGYLASLDSLSYPRFSDLYRPERYLKTIVSSRGCTYACVYCSVRQMWGPWRSRSVRSIEGEYDCLLRDHSVSTLAFADDEFTIDRDRIHDLCASLIARGNPFRWSFSARVEHVDPELLDWVVTAGCKSIFLGIESGSDRVLQRLGRRYTVADVHRIVSACRERGIIPVLSLMVGIPYETSDDVEATLRLLREANTHRLNLNVFTPFPGTPANSDPARYGIELLEPPGLPGVLNDDTGEVRHRTAHLDPEQIRDYWLEGVGIIMRRQQDASGLHQQTEHERASAP